MKSIYQVDQWEKQINKNSTRWTHPNPTNSEYWQFNGFVESNDHAANALGWWGIRYQAADTMQTQTVTVRLHCSINRNQFPESIRTIETTTVITSGSNGMIPFSSFDFDLGMKLLLKAIVAVEINGTLSPVELTELSLIERQAIVAKAPIKGKPLKIGEIVEYFFTLTNTTKKTQVIQIQPQRLGWEVLPLKILMDHKEVTGPLEIQPEEIKEFKLQVRDHSRFPDYGQEKQELQIITATGYEETISFVTVRHSEDFLTNLRKEDVEEIKKKISNCDWAQEKYKLLYEEAEIWEPPTINSSKPYLFVSTHADEADNAALIYLLSGEERFAKKVASFLKNFVDIDYGYLKLPHAGNQELVHEGEVFKHIALAYDRIMMTNLLTDEEHKRIAAAFRIFMGIIADECQRGKISNWNLAELSGVIACSAVLQDIERMEFFLFGYGGVIEHIAKGVLDDGWWYEASIGYNLLAMGIFLEINMLVDKWGYALHSMKVPANFANYYDINQKNLPAKDRIDGLTAEVWGPIHNNTRSIEMLVDSMISFYSYDGVIFGMNDSSESRAIGVRKTDPRYDLAYRIYQKTEYLPLLHTILPEDRDLCYGVAELPAFTEEDASIHNISCQAEVAGITLLRSKAEGRIPREQYEVSVKTGILGGAHGHYDRLALNSIRRFGKSFYNPENVWYAYHTFMYKFYVQNSITHNMTTVDLKQQDPQEASTLAFYSDEKFQYVVHEIKAAWCNPPYGGWRVGVNETLKERAWNEGRHLDLPEEAPEYTVRTQFTEEILQRRATIVTDDYVLIMDYLEGEKEHNFDCLYHASGLKSIATTGSSARTLLSGDPTDSRYFFIDDQIHYQKTTERLDDNLLSSGQFVTDCHWFTTNENVKTHFEIEIADYNDCGWLTPLRTSQNEHGLLKLDIHCITPREKEIMIGNEPQYYQTQQQLHYSIVVDEEKIHENKMGTWIFGREEIEKELPANSKKLVLTTCSHYVQNEYGSNKDIPLPAIFWGEGEIETMDGRKIPLDELPFEMKNIQPVPEKNRDYFGGPVKLQTKKMVKSLAGTPAEEGVTGTITFDLQDIVAKKIRVYVGGDYPLGTEKDHRRLLGFRQYGRKANFITAIEQYEEDSVIESIEQIENAIVISLKDGGKDIIEINNFDLSSPTISLIKE